VVSLKKGFPIIVILGLLIIIGINYLVIRPVRIKSQIIGSWYSREPLEDDIKDIELTFNDDGTFMLKQREGRWTRGIVWSFVRLEGTYETSGANELNFTSVTKFSGNCERDTLCSPFVNSAEDNASINIRFRNPNPFMSEDTRKLCMRFSSSDYPERCFRPNQTE